MARRGTSKDARGAAAPAPLPPESRTIGQLVAETIRIYGARFALALPLGLPLAAFDEVALGRGFVVRMVVLLVAAPFLTAAYAGATVLVTGRRAGGRAWAVALAAGIAVWLPAAAVFPWFAVAAVAWLALVGAVVPAAIVEGIDLRSAFRRGIALGRADYVHAAGSLATLVILFGVTRLALGVLLRSQADATIRIAVFLADAVLGPMLFLGAAVLYLDQSARATRPGRRLRRAEAGPADR